MRSAPGLPHVRGVGLESLGDLLQLGGQLLLGRGLALLPLAGLVPDRPPPSSLGPGRVDGDPALQLDDLAAAAGGVTSGTGRRPGRAGPLAFFPQAPALPALPRPDCGTSAGRSAAGDRPALRRTGCGESVGILARLGAAVVIRDPLFLLYAQVRGLTGECESVVRGGVEPPTFRFSGGRSYRLSYLTSARCSAWLQPLRS